MNSAPRKPPTPEEVRRPQFMIDLDVTQWINLPMNIVEYRMTDRFPASVRLFALITRFTCGYNQPYCVSVERGRIRTDRDGTPLPMTQAEMAQRLGMAPPNVNRMLRSFEKHGLIRFQGKKVF